jgi:hypothetical protein
LFFFFPRSLLKIFGMREAKENCGRFVALVAAPTGAGDDN